ncbi:unnamed protein product, partial [Didymodactylos carnosus]
MAIASFYLVLHDVHCCSSSPYRSLFLNNVCDYPYSGINTEEKLIDLDHDDFASYLLESIQNTNVIVSPIGIQLILSILALGARGVTQQQILRVLSYRLVNTSTDDYFIANRLYVQNDTNRLLFNNDYINQLKRLYKCDVKQVDNFQENRLRIAEEINQWVEKQTHYLIENAFHPGLITPRTNMILVNCVYFE